MTKQKAVANNILGFLFEFWYLTRPDRGNFRTWLLRNVGNWEGVIGYPY